MANYGPRFKASLVPYTASTTMPKMEPPSSAFAAWKEMVADEHGPSTLKPQKPYELEQGRFVSFIGELYVLLLLPDAERLAHVFMSSPAH